jgi:hypothetical protein
VSNLLTEAGAATGSTILVEPGSEKLVRLAVMATGMARDTARIVTSLGTDNFIAFATACDILETAFICPYCSLKMKKQLIAYRELVLTDLKIIVFRTLVFRGTKLARTLLGKR